jgi:hypothetical protein
LSKAVLAAEASLDNFSFAARRNMFEQLEVSQTSADQRQPNQTQAGHNPNSSTTKEANIQKEFESQLQCVCT